MLDKLILHNFQSHTYSELDFDPGVNVIVGPSDSGKTAIIRALRWLVWGRPLGDSFIHHGKYLCKVSIELSRQKILREKVRGGETSYQFLDRRYTALKTEVPEEVRAFLNLGETNLQQQLDRPFLLDSSPGQIAQHWNRVVHLDVIDSGIKKILSWTRQLTQELLSKRELLKSLKEEVTKFDYVDEMEPRVIALEEGLNQLNSLDSQRKEIERILSTIEEINEKRSQYRSLIKLESSVKLIERQIEKKDQIAEQKAKLERLINSFSILNLKEQKAQRLIRLEDSVNRVQEEKETLKSKTRSLDAISRTLQSYRRAESLYQAKLKTLEELEEKYHKEFPDICPLCGQKVRKNNGAKS